MNSDKSIIANFQRIIYEPTNVRGQKYLNRSLAKAQYINVIQWGENPNNVNIVKYRIYSIEGADRRLLAELGPRVFEYQQKNVDKDKTYYYILVAVNDEVREGYPASISIR
jgi:hypothetical protein